MKIGFASLGVIDSVHLNRFRGHSVFKDNAWLAIDNEGDDAFVRYLRLIRRS